MGFGIKSIAYQTETRGAVDLSVLQACIGERIKVITELYFDQIYTAIDSVDKRVFFNPGPEITGLPYNADLIWFEDGDYLNNCQVGDLFITDGIDTVTGTFTLLEILNGGLGRFDRTFDHDEDGDKEGEYVANITPLKALLYQFGINASGDYISATDDSIQKFSLNSGTSLDGVASQNMLATGYKDWQIDSVLMEGQGDDSNFPSLTRVIIKVSHSTVVTPLYLAGQYDNMRNGLAPDYFKPDNLLKYQAQFDWNKSSTFLDPNKSITLDPVGKFGWFGTKYNGDPSDYSIGSLTIQRVSDSEFIDDLEYNEVEVKFIVSSSGATFSATQSALVFGFNYLPDTVGNYQNTNRTLERNFCFDSKRFLPNGTPVNGNNFGNAYQVIKTVKGDILTANTMRVTARILFGGSQAQTLQQDEVAQYAMWCIAERIDLNTEVCDKSNLLVQVSTVHVQLTTVDLITATTKFIEHPYDQVGNGQDTLEMFPVDDIAVNSSFAIDYTGKENDGILLKSCTPKIVLTHATEADILLDSFRINLDNFPTVGSAPAVQSIDFNQNRPYKIEDGIRKTIAFERDYAADTGSTKYFVLNFPFMNRWEYWIQIAGLTSLPESLFDPSVPFNGANHLWNRLANTSGWTLKYRVTFEIIQNGEVFEQEFEYELTSTYFESNTDWNNCSIKFYDPVTNDEIISGGKKYVYASKDTKVVASFEKTVGDVPDIDHIAIVIWGEPFEGSGVAGITRISSVWPVTDVSIFKSVDGSNKTKVTKTAAVFTGEALIKSEKINTLSKLGFYARIYEVENIDELGRVTNDYILRYTDDGFVRLVLS